MQRYIMVRLLTGLVTLLGVSLIVFGMLNLVPGDPIAALVDGGYTPEQAEGLRQQLGLDRPLPERYAVWLAAVVRGDFGVSFKTGQRVSTIIKDSLPVTFELGVATMLLTMIAGIPLGVWSAVRQDKLDDHVIRIVSITGLSVPSFWIGTMVVVLPAVWWGWTPPLFYKPFSEDPLANLGVLVAPALILAFNSAASLMRITRSSVLEVLREDYVRTARSKGLAGRLVLVRHVLRNALLPVLTVLGGQLAFVVGGAVVIETIFNLPGMGRSLVTGLTFRDYPVVQGINLVLAVTIVASNILIDLLYPVVDPRISY